MCQELTFEIPKVTLGAGICSIKSNMLLFLALVQNDGTFSYFNHVVTLCQHFLLKYRTIVLDVQYLEVFIYILSFQNLCLEIILFFEKYECFEVHLFLLFFCFFVFCSFKDTTMVCFNLHKLGPLMNIFNPQYKSCIVRFCVMHMYMCTQLCKVNHLGSNPSFQFVKHGALLIGIFCNPPPHFKNEVLFSNLFNFYFLRV